APSSRSVAWSAGASAFAIAQDVVVDSAVAPVIVDGAPATGQPSTPEKGMAPDPAAQQLLDITAAVAGEVAQGAAPTIPSGKKNVATNIDPDGQSSDPSLAAAGEVAEIAADTDAVDDVLSLLSVPFMSPAPQEAIVAEKGRQPGTVVTGAQTSLAGALADGELSAGVSMESPASAEGVAFPLQKADAASAGIDMHVAPATDGSVEVEAAPSVAKDMPLVQVVDSRRYLGLAPDSNAAAVMSAIADDPRWAGALDPASRLTNTSLSTGTGNVVQTLKIQMNPADLGQISATMRLVGEELTIRLSVHNSNAYRELSADSAAIVDALKAQGFSVDQISVTMSSSGDRSETGSGGRQAADMGQSQQQNGRQSGEGRQAGRSPESPTGAKAVGGGDAGTVEGADSARTGSARPGHVYL
ncbi:MAG TPA: flagellar hook-length control protein FliK, partial [Rhizobium sp.]|nr:flagellar hook-length control protein FliK [Rhizobium sp.]